MTTTKESWDQVGESWRDLGRQLQERYRQLTEGQAREAEKDRAKLDEAARQLSDHVGDALRAMKDIVADPDIKSSLDRVVRTTGAAISTTVDEAAGEIRKHLPKTGGEAAPAPRPPKAATDGEEPAAPSA